MKYTRYIMAAAVAVLTACSSADDHYCPLLVDFNSTAGQTIYAYSIGDLQTPIDSAKENDGRFLLNMGNWPHGFYTIGSDSACRFNIINNGTPAMVCVRRNHTDEATTDNRHMALLWQIEQLQRDLRSVRSDSLRGVMKARGLALLDSVKGSILTLPLLNVRDSVGYLFNIIGEHSLFEQAAIDMKASMPGNDDVKAFAAMVDEARRKARFVKRYGQGNEAPAFELTLSSGRVLTNESFEKQPYVLFYCSDTTSRYDGLWQTVALKRFDNYRIVAQIGGEMTQLVRPGVNIGIFADPLAADFEGQQPVVIYVNASGNITKMLMQARTSDL